MDMNDVRYASKRKEGRNDMIDDDMMKEVIHELPQAHSMECKISKKAVTQ